MCSNHRSRRGFLLCTVVAALLAAGVGYLLMERLRTDSMQSVQQRLDDWRVTLMLLRWAAIAIVAFGWRYGIARLLAAGRIHSTQAALLNTLRWDVVTWLVLLELVLGQGVMVRFLRLITEALPLG